MANINRDILDISKRIEERNISLVIDASGSMYKNFEIIKEAAILLINSLLNYRKNANFNIISFADQSSTFSNSMIPYSNENLALATAWINSLNCESNTNTLSALVTAFSDSTDAVIIFTDGLPNQKASVFQKCVTEVSQGRPIHCIYVSNGYADSPILQFWEKLVTSVDGSLHILFNGSNKKLKSKQIYPYELVYNNYSDSDSLSGYSSSSSYFDSDSSSDNETVKSDFIGKEKDHFLGKIVLAKRRSNGFYYKATIIDVLSAELFVVLFQPSSNIKFQLQQKCCKDDLVFFEDASKEKLYSGDHVLVNCSSSKKKYIPGCIRKKEYLFDDDDRHGYDKVLKIDLFDGGSKTVPLDSAVKISPKFYKEIVEHIKQKQQIWTTRRKEESEDKRIKRRRKSKRGKVKYDKHDVDLESESSYRLNMDSRRDDQSDDFQMEYKQDLLRSRIEKQLKESQELLSSLNIQNQDTPKDDFYDSGIAVDPYENIAYDRLQQLKHLRKSYEELYTPSIASEMPEQFESGLIGKKFRHRTRSADVRFTVATPPPAAWKTTGKKSARSPRHRVRSASVSSNAVERSKKHWYGGSSSARENSTPSKHWNGRPITKETSPKKHTGRYRSKKSPATAEEYQTVDGIPLPVKTDKPFYGYHSDNWVAGQRHVPGYKHHDIIAHRVVAVDKNNNKPPIDKSRQERQERNREKVANTNRNIYEMRARDNQIKQYLEREKQMKKHQEHRENREHDGYTKVKITIEKDASSLRHKQHQQEIQRKYEKEREMKNQERKFKRIDAMRERKKEKPIKDVQKPIESKKEYIREKSKINRQIEDHESKLERLKKMRRHTDARLRHLKNSNDYHRDMTEHVKDEKMLSTTMASMFRDIIDQQ